MKILKIVPAILSLFSLIFSIFKKKEKPEVLKKEEDKIEKEVKSGDISALNKELGWKD